VLNRVEFTSLKYASAAEPAPVLLPRSDSFVN